MHPTPLVDKTNHLFDCSIDLFSCSFCLTTFVCICVCVLPGGLGVLINNVGIANQYPELLVEHSDKVIDDVLMTSC